MKRKGFLAILTAMAMIGSMGVCVYAADDVMADYKGKADYKIGFSQCTLASPFYVTMKEAAEDYAKQLGVDFVCVSADDDVTKQNNDKNKVAFFIFSNLSEFINVFMLLVLLGVCSMLQM